MDELWHAHIFLFYWLTLKVQSSWVHDQNVAEKVWWSWLPGSLLPQTSHGKDAISGEIPGLSPSIFSFSFFHQEFLVDAPDDINIEAGPSKYAQTNFGSVWYEVLATYWTSKTKWWDIILHFSWSGQQSWVVLWSRATQSFCRPWWLSTEGQG